VGCGIPLTIYTTATGFADSARAVLDPL